MAPGLEKPIPGCHAQLENCRFESKPLVSVIEFFECDYVAADCRSELGHEHLRQARQVSPKVPKPVRGRRSELRWRHNSVKAC